MKKISKNSQKGAISLFVMVAMLFFIVTVLGVFSISSKRAQTQADSLAKSKEKYYSGNANSIYNEKVAENAGKIYNKEQLWNIKSGGTYALQNDIVINVTELKGSNINYLKSIATINYGNYNIYYYYNNNYYTLNKYYNGSSVEYTKPGSLSDALYASGTNFQTITTTVPSGKYYSFASTSISG